MSTTNMNLNLPVPSTTPGPQWATSVNQAFETVDAHDHSSGNGVKVTPAGMNIISDLLFNNNSATGVKTVRLQNQGAVPNNPSDLGCIVNVNGDLWWRNAAGTGVQLTSGAGINIASVGTIGGDYGQPGVAASVAYSDLTKTFTFLRGSGETAEMLVGDLSIQNQASGSLAVTIKASASTGAYELTLPLVAPTSDSVLSFDLAGQATFRTITGTAGEVTVTPSPSTHQVSLPSTVTKNLTLSGNNIHSGSATFSGSETHSGSVSFTGATSGRGIVPLGAVLPTFPSLTGAYACVATIAADANGFVQCNGQTISDVTSPMNGAVIPNINDDVFLRGNATSGAAGGSNANITLATTNLPSHAHDMGHGHADTFGLTGTTSFASSNHTHSMQHLHQWNNQFRSTGTGNPTIDYTVTSPNLSTYTWTTSGTGVGQFQDTNIPLDSVAGSRIWYGPNPLVTPGNSKRLYTGAAINAGLSAVDNTGSNSASASVGFSGSVTGHAGNTGSAGSGTSFSVTPKYITARYVMRIK